MNRQAAGYKNYVVIVLMLVYTSNYLDRSILAVISPAIKTDLGLSDTQLGLLKGLIFAGFYATLSIPVAWLADRWNRISIISISVALWSLFTALAAITVNFVQLALTRIGVGVAEAGGVAPSHSVISDYFGVEERARALGIYALALPLGDTLALVLGGWVLENYGWRSVFLVIGIPGLILALILKLTVQEPVRGAADGLSTRKNDSASAVGFLEGVKRLLRMPSFRMLIVATSLATFSTNGFWYWQIDYFVRAFKMTYTEITIPLAIITVIFASVGTYLGGYFCDKFRYRTTGAFGFAPAIMFVLAAPAILLFVSVPTSIGAFACAGAFAFAANVVIAPAFATAQYLAPLRLRAVASSLLFASIILFGVGLGPTWVGVVSDIAARHVSETWTLKIAMGTTAGTVALSCFAYYLLGKRILKL